MKVGLLGGSFDPLHLGHLLLGGALRSRCRPDAIWLLPVAHHVFEKSLSSFEDRLEMARIGARELGGGAEAKDTERQLVAAGGDGSSVSLLRHLTATHPGIEFLFVMGSDAYAQRAAWREFSALEQLARIVVVNRQGSPLVEGGGPPLPNISSSEIRALVRAGQPIAELVTPGVEDYIEYRGLYR